MGSTTATSGILTPESESSTVPSTRGSVVSSPSSSSTTENLTSTPSISDTSVGSSTVSNTSTSSIISGQSTATSAAIITATTTAGSPGLFTLLECDFSSTNLSACFVDGEGSVNITDGKQFSNVMILNNSEPFRGPTSSASALCEFPA